MDKQSRQSQHPTDQGKLAKKIKNFIYHPGDQIGSGFSSHVYKGVNQLQPDPSRKNIAIKVIQLSKITNQVQNYLLNNQVNALKLLKHPNVLQTVDILMTKNNVYIVTQFCQGGDLLKYIKSNGPFNQIRALTLIKDIIQGYKCIEENNILHRDLKTSNIFLSKGRAKIADFGFCQFVGQKKPNVGYNVGSPAYMSPQSYKQCQYSNKSDIWAIGIILYEMLVGQTPQKTSTYTQMTNNLINGRIKNIQNQDIKRILCLCFKKNVKQRIDVISLLDLVTNQLNKLQNRQAVIARQRQLLAAKSGQVLPPRSLSPTKNRDNANNANNNIKFFKAQNPSSTTKLPQANVTVNTSLTNRLNQAPSQKTQQPARRSLTKQRQSQPLPSSSTTSTPSSNTPQPQQQHQQLQHIKSSLLKPHTQYLLFLYRLLKFIIQVKFDKILLTLLPIFRHRNLIQNLVEQQTKISHLQQQQAYKQFQYLKARFDQVYLQYTKQSSSNSNTSSSNPSNKNKSQYKQKLDSLTNIPFTSPESLHLYRIIFKQACTQCLSLLEHKNLSSITTCNKNQIGIVLDYLMIQYQLLGLHMQGMAIGQIMGISKLGEIIRQQPKKLSNGHIQLLKIKYNMFMGMGQDGGGGISGGSMQMIHGQSQQSIQGQPQTQTISKQSQSHTQSQQSMSRQKQTLQYPNTTTTMLQPPGQLINGVHNNQVLGMLMGFANNPQPGPGQVGQPQIQQITNIIQGPPPQPQQLYTQTQLRPQTKPSAPQNQINPMQLQQQIQNNIQYSAIVNQIPVHQSIMMPR